MRRLPPLPVLDPSQVGAVRRAAVNLAELVGYSEHDVARVGIVATEMATNLVKHARDGEVVVQTSAAVDAEVVELIALDRGPGIANLTEVMRDGMSSVGTPGTGLGAISRVASRFDCYSQPGKGTVVFTAVAPAPPPAGTGFEVGGVCVPYPGEHECGDGFEVEARNGRALVVVTDGLGHGASAAAASERAAEVFRDHRALAPVELMQRLHDGMRATRGAAAAAAEVDARRGVVRYCGVGNIAATIVSNGSTRSLVSHHGTLGHDARRIAEFQYPWPPGSLLVLHSDGLTPHWTLSGYPGLSERAGSLIAAVLYRDFRRQRDDTTVVVLRERS